MIKRIIEQTPTLPLKLRQDARGLELKLLDLRERFTGDPTRARERLGWRASHSFQQLIERMVEADLRALERRSGSA